MSFARTLRLIAAVHLVGTATALAENLCPAGPFETDIHAIAAAIAAEPPKPVSWYAERAISNAPIGDPLTDGASMTGSGGFMSTGGASTEYDAKRYVIVETQWSTKRSDFDSQRLKPAKPPNQVIRKVGNLTYMTIIGRPAPEDAREFACVANELLAPSHPKPPPSSFEPPSDPHWNGDITIVGHTRRPGCPEPQFSDGHMESFVLMTSRPGMKYNTDLSCTAQAELEGHLKEIVSDAVDDITTRREGKWQPPRVHSLAMDVTDDLYLLLDPGTRRRRSIEVLRVKSSGEVMHLSETISEHFYGGALAADSRGHAWVPSSEMSGAVFYDFSRDTRSDLANGNRPFGNRGEFESIAADTNGNLFAMHLSQIFKIPPTGAVMLLGDANIENHEVADPVFEEQFHIAVDRDGMIFVADATANIILKMSSDHSFTIVAGVPTKAGAQDGIAGEARFNAPQGLALDHEGNIYVADSGNHTIRRIARDGSVSTLAGMQGKRGTRDGHGASARLDSPTSIAIDSADTLYVTNGTDNLIRKISAAGEVSTVDARKFMAPQ
jgi:NHL repeat